MSFARRSLLASLAFTAVAALVAIHLPAHARTKKALLIGATVGRYADQAKLGIKPLLEAKGYKVKVVTEALALEKTTATYQNLVAVRSADKDSAWVKDIADAYRSREFLAITETRFAGFVKTDYQQSLQASAAK